MKTVEYPRFIFASAALAHDFFLEFMGQCSLLSDGIVICRTVNCIEAAKKMGGTKIADSE